LQGLVIGVVLAAFVALGLAVYVQHREIAADAARYGDLRAINASLSADNARFKDAAAAQNEKLAAWRAAVAVRARRAALAVRRARAQARQDEILAAHIGKEKTGGDDCRAAQAILRDYLKARRPGMKK